MHFRLLHCLPMTRKNRVKQAGNRLRELREKLGFSMRDVQASSASLARRSHNRAFKFGISRLSQYEAQGVVPNIYALSALAVIYRRPMRELLRWYGVRL